MADGIRLHELAWAAGLFEGEGTAGAHGERSVEARLGMTDEDIVRRFAEIVEVGVVRPYTPLGLGSKPMWYWRVSSAQDVQHVMCLLWQWLGPRRRNQFRKTAERARATGKKTMLERTVGNRRLCRTCRRWLSVDLFGGKGRGRLDASCRKCSNARHNAQRKAARAA